MMMMMMMMMNSTLSTLLKVDKDDRIGDSRLRCRFVAGFGNSRLCRQYVPGLKG